jgi:hypothetical protein
MDHWEEQMTARLAAIGGIATDDTERIMSILRMARRASVLAERLGCAELAWDMEGHLVGPGSTTIGDAIQARP